MRHYYFRKITNGDLSCIPDMIEYFEKELSDALDEVRISGNIEANNKQMPGLMSQRFSQLQEIDAIIVHMETVLRKLKTEKFRTYLENYNRSLTSRDADRYADGDAEVIDMMLLINQIALMRNQFLGVTKALEQKSYALSNITKLRAAGLDTTDL